MCNDVRTAPWLEYKHPVAGDTERLLAFTIPVIAVIMISTAVV